MTFDASDLAEQAAWDKLHAISDEGLSDILNEMSGDMGSEAFMALLAAVRDKKPFEIGVAFKRFAHVLILETIDGDELAHQADEDARAEAADARRDQHEFLGR